MLGGAGLHPRRGVGALEIGYWMRSARTGRGLTTEAAGALTRVAFEVRGVDRVEIRCDPGNVASAAIPPKLGFTHEATLRRRLQGVNGEGDLRDAMIFSLFASDYPDSPAERSPVEAFDAADRPLSLR